MTSIGIAADTGAVRQVTAAVLLSRLFESSAARSRIVASVADVAEAHDMAIEMRATRNFQFLAAVKDISSGFSHNQDTANRGRRHASLIHHSDPA